MLEHRRTHTHAPTYRKTDYVKGNIIYSTALELAHARDMRKRHVISHSQGPSRPERRNRGKGRQQGGDSMLVQEGFKI